MSGFADMKVAAIRKSTSILRLDVAGAGNQDVLRPIFRRYPSRAGK